MNKNNNEFFHHNPITYVNGARVNYNHVLWNAQASVSGGGGVATFSFLDADGRPLLKNPKLSSASFWVNQNGNLNNFDNSLNFEFGNVTYNAGAHSLSVKLTQFEKVEDYSSEVGFYVRTLRTIPAGNGTVVYMNIIGDAPTV